MADLWVIFWFALIAALVAGGLILITVLSVSRMVWLHKHPAWSFQAAFDYVYWRSLKGLAFFGGAVAAIWLLPRYLWIPLTTDNVAFGQFIATFMAVVIVNVHYHFVILPKISRPPT